MTIRRMSHVEVKGFFGSHRENGFIAEEDGLVVGVVGFNTYLGYFFVHSCFTCDARAYLVFHKKLVATAKRMGYQSFSFAIDHSNTAWLSRASKFPGVFSKTTIFEWEFK